MEKHLNKRTVTGGFVFAIFIFFLLSIISYEKIGGISAAKITPAPAQMQTNSVSYSGKNGQNALTLLQKKTAVVEDHSGMVISINGRKANSAVHEYWAFYVNGALAQVGPASYMTKNTDKITWKIEKY